MDHHYRLMRALVSVTEDLERIVPPDETIVLVDDDAWGWQWGPPGTMAGRPALLFFARDGHFWGRPRDDEEAIAELERCVGAGGRYLVFAREARWWLDHYQRFATHVRHHSQVVLDSDHMTVYEVGPRLERSAV